MFFRKRKQRTLYIETSQDDPVESFDSPGFYYVDFDKMLKGNVIQRSRKNKVRQFGVTVNGSTRLVTSGDVVDRATYEALLAAKAILPSDHEEVDVAEEPGAYPTEGE